MIEKERSRKVFIVLWTAGILCLCATLVLDSSNADNALLVRGLRFAVVILWAPGLIYLVRSRAKTG